MEFFKRKTTYLIFGLIMAAGIFFRVYDFHNWLDFSTDQVRDAVLVDQVVKGETSWPLLGPTMRKSGSSKNDLFHLGPVYYYFQIASAEIFGNDPDKLAYPDLLFSILSIPLFYFFLKRYFSGNIPLAIAGLYAVSFYAILYSRFAWNPNSIPFFAILFLLSLHEFLTKKEKTSWMWLISVGVAAGVGIQLHIILFILFPTILFFVFLFLMKKNWKIWNRWAVVFSVIVFLNIPQITSETRNNYANSKAFLYSIANGNQNKKSGILQKINDNIDCHIEANAYILSALGNSECDFSYTRLLESKKSSVSLKKINDPVFWIFVIPSFLFSVFGYIFLFKRFRKEKTDDKRYFLGLIIFYAAVSFIIMIPVIASGLLEFRYFIHIFFVPFVFLGLLVTFLVGKYPKKYPIMVLSIFLFLIVTNMFTAGMLEKELSAKLRNDDHHVVLGETESMLKYIIANSGNQKEIYLVGDSTYAANFSKALAYLAEKQNVDIINAADGKKISQEKPVFYIWKSSKNGIVNEFGGKNVESYENFGQVGIYKLQN